MGELPDMTGAVITGACCAVDDLLVTYIASVPLHALAHEPRLLVLRGTPHHYRDRQRRCVCECSNVASGSFGTRRRPAVVLINLALVSIPPHLTVAGVPSREPLGGGELELCELVCHSHCMILHFGTEYSHRNRRDRHNRLQ